MASTYRPRRYNFNWSSFITPGVKLLVLICTGVFLAEVLIFLIGGSNPIRWVIVRFGLIPSAVTHGLRIWQPLTYIFLHDPTGPWHLLINMLVLWMFGRDLELSWGKKRFLNYFLLCGVGAGLIEVVVKTIPTFFGHAPSDIPSIGASGAIFGVLMANAVLFPDRRIWLIPLPITIPMRPYVAVMGAIEFFGTLGASDGIGHLCHLGGMLVGYFYLRRGSLLYSVRNTVSDWQHRRNRRRFDVYINKHKGDPPSRPDRWVN